MLVGSVGFIQSQQSQQQKSGKATLTGRVVSKGEPVRNAIVILVPSEGGDHNRFPKTRTDTNGEFRFDKLANGAYNINAEAGGYVNSSYGIGNRINIGDGENLENFEIELKRGGAISGRVVDEYGQVVTETRINLLKANERGDAQRTHARGWGMTDDRGMYRLYGIPAGRYLVSVGSSNTSYDLERVPTQAYIIERYHSDVSDRSKANVIEIVEGSDIEGIDIKIGPMGMARDIYGHVIDATTGKGLSGITLLTGVLVENGSHSRGGGDQSDDNGAFHLSSLKQGKYWIIPSDDKTKGYFGDPVELVLGDEDVHGIEIKMYAGATISGKAVFEGIDDPALKNMFKSLFFNSQRIQSSNSNSSRGGQVMPPQRSSIHIEANGDFVLKGVETGKSYLSMGYRGHGAEGVILRRVEHQGRIVDRIQGFDIKPGEKISNVRVILGYPDLSLRGEIKVVGGGGLPKDVNLNVVARGIDGDKIQRHTTIDLQRRFILDHLDTGEYEVEIRHYPNNNEPMTDQIKALMAALKTSKQKIFVTQKNQPLVLTIDLNQK